MEIRHTANYTRKARHNFHTFQHARSLDAVSLFGENCCEQETIERLVRRWYLRHASRTTPG